MSCSQGGGATRENLQPFCELCDMKQSNREEFEHHILHETESSKHFRLRDIWNFSLGEPWKISA